MNREQAIREEVERLLELLSDRAERLRAASTLGRIGVRTRGGSPTRGTLSAAAPPRFSAKLNLEPLFEALYDERPEVRREACFALGELGDSHWEGRAIQELVRLATQDPNPSVRAFAAQSLGKIGGQLVLEPLEMLARQDRSEEVRARAASALAALLRTTQTTMPRLCGAVKTKGALRTRGTGRAEEKIARIRRLLKTIRNTDPSEYVRETAEDNLFDLAD